MRKQEFIDSLCEAGWQATNDAQHSKITLLWEKLFPVVAQLEAELEDTEMEILAMGERD